MKKEDLPRISGKKAGGFIVSRGVSERETMTLRPSLPACAEILKR
jgi:hypothetical protein